MPEAWRASFPVGAGVDGPDVDAEAPLDVAGLLLHALRPIMPGESDLGALERGDNGGGVADDPGCAEDQDPGLGEALVLFLFQQLLDAGDHGGGRRERASGIGEGRNLEGLQKRRAKALHHVEGEPRVLAADEHGRARCVLRRARKHRVLDQRGDVLERDEDIGRDRIIAGVERHVHVERTHVLQRTEHVQNILGHSLLSYLCAADVWPFTSAP